MPASALERLSFLARRLGLDAEAFQELLEVAEAFGAEERATAGPAHEDAYSDLGLIGHGGMGEVRRVRDRVLDRNVAMKVLRAELLRNDRAVMRFVAEACTTAQLQHPSIVPVHARGVLPDGRAYFTMKEVRGRTLSDVIREVHEASSSGRWEAGPSGWTFRRVIDAVHRVCEAVAFAHSRCVVHRDLKPDNVMVGDFGEVVVLDWGLACSFAASDIAARRAEAGTRREIHGTPAYMAPEQARGEDETLGPRWDVYALGALLYECLVGRPPYTGTVAQILAQIEDGPPPPPGRVFEGGTTMFLSVSPGEERPGEPLPVPPELQAICVRAMARDPAERHAHASALAADIAAWLEGARKREQALAVIAEAERLWEEVEPLRAKARGRRNQAEAQLRDVKPWEPIARKRPAWDLLADAARLEREADLREIQFTQHLGAALAHVPDLRSAHARLAAYYRSCHAQAEAARDAAAAFRFETLLRHHDTGEHTAYLAGEGSFSLTTTPPGAEVRGWRYVERDRRLVPVDLGFLGVTPIRRQPLPMGSYLLEVTAVGCEPTRYPLLVGRGEHVDPVRPGEARSFPLRLPEAGSLGPDDVYVPAGWFWCGGDAATNNSLPRRRVWVDGFVLRRHPVTNREYIAFLDDLVRQGREEEALQHVPRERAGTADGQGSMIYGRAADGRFQLVPDAEGDVWDLDWPVFLVDWYGASAYARWLGEQTGELWRLPGELEREKAARGVDGRYFPWGDALDPTWTCMGASHPDRPLPASVHAHPDDASPYGVHGLGGNVRDWCIDRQRLEGPPVNPGGRAAPPEAGDEDPAVARVFRGGSWLLEERYQRAAFRGFVLPRYRLNYLGFRVARSFP